MIEIVLDLIIVNIVDGKFWRQNGLPKLQFDNSMNCELVYNNYLRILKFFCIFKIFFIVKLMKVKNT
jgi:hypothetical protein